MHHRLQTAWCLAVIIPVRFTMLQSQALPHGHVRKLGIEPPECPRKTMIHWEGFPRVFPWFSRRFSPNFSLVHCDHSHRWEVHRVCDHNGLGCQVLWRMAQLVPHVPLRRRTWLDQSKMSRVPWAKLGESYQIAAISCGCLMNKQEIEIYKILQD